jgi:hypothetical protein
MTARFDRIKERLSVLVGAGYMAHWLSNLALSEVDISWDDLSADDISQLAAWCGSGNRRAIASFRLSGRTFSPPSLQYSRYATQLLYKLLSGPTARREWQSLLTIRPRFQQI